MNSILAFWHKLCQTDENFNQYPLGNYYTNLLVYLALRMYKVFPPFHNRHISRTRKPVLWLNLQYSIYHVWMFLFRLYFVNNYFIFYNYSIFQIQTSGIRAPRLFCSPTRFPSTILHYDQHFDGFVQDYSISIACALEILLSCNKPSYKTTVSPLLTYWRYCSLALSHRFDVQTFGVRWFFRLHTSPSFMMLPPSWSQERWG